MPRVYFQVKSLTDLELKSADLICPGCGTCSMTVFLRCDVGDRECLTMGSCRTCGRQYHAEILPTYREKYKAHRRAAEQSHCPVCRRGPRRVHYVCDRVARECFFLLACPTCGDVTPV